jgi:hypothetical protein
VTEIFNRDEKDKRDGSAIDTDQHSFLVSGGGWCRVADESFIPLFEATLCLPRPALKKASNTASCSPRPELGG